MRISGRLVVALAAAQQAAAQPPCLPSRIRYLEQRGWTKGTREAWQRATWKHADGRALSGITAYRCEVERAALEILQQRGWQVFHDREARLGNGPRISIPAAARVALGLASPQTVRPVSGEAGVSAPHHACAPSRAYARTREDGADTRRAVDRRVLDRAANEST